jgi:serine/threonine-protein kinase
VGAPVGTRADVYALGVVLFELLAGVRPFEMRGRTAAEIERIVTESDPPAPSQAMGEDRAIALGERSAARARSRVQGDLDAIVLEALRKEPERRYGSADELATDLQRHLDGRPVAARPDGWGYRLGKLVRRRRAETAAVALVLVSVVGGLAATALQATRAERERARAAEVTSFLTTMLGAADPASFGRDVQVREVLDSAVVRADALADRPAFEAEIRDIIGGTYLALGEFETAESQYRLALDALGRDATTDDRTIAMTLTHLSTALEFEGRYAAADTVLQAATAVWDRVGYSDDDTKGDHFDQRGRILVRLGRFPESLPFFEEALAIQKAVRPPNDSALAYAYANLGVVQSELGQNEAAETLMVAGVEAARRAHGEVHPLVASILSPLATVQARAGSNDDADATFLLAIEIRRKLLGEEHPDYAWTMFSYADFLMTVGRNAEAIDWSRKVLALRGRSLQDAHPAISTAMSIVGRSLGRMDSIAAGERWLRESLELRRTTLPPDHWIIASAEGILGEHLVLAGRFTEAESLLLGSERALLAARGEDAPVIQDARTRLVQLYEAWAKPAEAEAWRSKLARPD